MKIDIFLKLNKYTLTKFNSVCFKNLKHILYNLKQCFDNWKLDYN